MDRKSFAVFCLAALVSVMSTGCVMTRFTESLLECGVTHTTPDFVEIAPEDRNLWIVPGKDGRAYFLCLPVVSCKQEPAQLYAFSVPVFVPFRFTKHRTEVVRRYQFFQLPEETADALIRGRKDGSLADTLAFLPNDAVSIQETQRVQKVPVDLYRRDLESGDALPVWRERSLGGWAVQIFLPLTFCADVVASVVGTVAVDCVIITSAGITWLTGDPMTRFPE